MKVSIIVAVGHDNVIGKDNDLIWHLPKDMKHFMDTTKGHVVIMGRKNYDSIPEKYRPLKGRTNVVVTRQTNFKADGCEVVNSLEAGIELARNANESECFIIGGGQIYQLALEQDLVDKMYITHIDESFDGDTFFPEIDEEEWNSEIAMEHKKDDQNIYDFVVVEYSKN